MQELGLAGLNPSEAGGTQASPSSSHQGPIPHPLHEEAASTALRSARALSGQGLVGESRGEILRSLPGAGE